LPATSIRTLLNAGCRSASVVAIFIAGLFFYCAGFGLRTPFGYDDITNITVAWQAPLHELLLALLVPFTTFYRPAGSAVYRLLFDLFGLNPLPFRIFVYTLLLLNLWLVYKLASRLSRSPEIGALAAFLYTFHTRLSLIYLNNGTLYDVLCATFTFLTLLYYIGARQQGQRLSPLQWLKLLALFICAINSKEMAAIIPVLLLLYELLFESKRQYAPAVICGALTILSALVKTHAGSPLSNNPGYAMTFTAAQFLQHSQKLMNDLIYAKGRGWSIPQVLAAWLALIAIAAVVRKRHFWFFAAFALLAPLPVLFIPYRGFFVMYLPYAGWCMAAATLLRLPKIHPAIPFLLAAAFIATRPRPTLNDPAHAIIADTEADLRQLNLPLPKGASVLFLHDRFPPTVWGANMTTRLFYRDPTLNVDTPAHMDHPPVLAAYDHVFDYIDGHLKIQK
jgi:hypothetical protein